MAGGGRIGGVAALLGLSLLLLAACADPERVRLASLPAWPPVPPPKPAHLPSAPPSMPVGVAPQSAPAATLVRPDSESYVVQRGDTLFSISQRVGVPLAGMIAANGLEAPFELRVGQRLALPAVRVHEVRRGETLAAVARHYDLETTELARVNRLDPPYPLWTGQRLVLPGPVGAEPAPEVAVTLAEAAAATEPAGGAEEVTTAPLSSGQEDGAGVETGSGTELWAAPETAPEPPSGEAAAPQAAPLAAPSAGQEAARPQAVAVPAPPPRSGGRFLWPLQGEMLARFGPQGDGRHNDGINIGAERGSEVRAAENGVVAYAGNELRGFGNLLLIKHADDWVTAYAHNDQLLVGAGESVTRGQPIARVGSSGSVGRPQLHFEIRKGTRAIDPLPLLDGAGG